ncbi:dUTP diphosphatase [Fulvimarina sp. 2208YS6-2-32]|uniref:Deoxyuridine 5'-triphosphate nucleotidohydrolase n=1 Tax=Fulvimarina uroteuthidis TaxID=3098149 RepID=A0ABU5I1H4_9HYPH|nr:dUTP diphosphatase [Fulvimarina sp. 2208YS6-2-32]MDY8109230.1 dUTP diphosphatase [Fulvimarina sp. 2208YS6-2-32]
MSRTIVFRRLSNGEGIDPPRYETAGSAGADIRAAVEDAITLAPGARAAISTGFAFAVPQGFEMQIRPRSGLAARHGVTVLNAPGTVDSDFRGEVKVLLVNLGAYPFTIGRGDRIAQIVIAPVTLCRFEETDDLGVTIRGAGGFGSTGV